MCSAAVHTLVFEFKQLIEKEMKHQKFSTRTRHGWQVEYPRRIFSRLLNFVLRVAVWAARPGRCAQWQSRFVLFDNYVFCHLILCKSINFSGVRWIQWRSIILRTKFKLERIRCIGILLELSLHNERNDQFRGRGAIWQRYYRLIKTVEKYRNQRYLPHTHDISSIFFVDLQGQNQESTLFT